MRINKELYEWSKKRKKEDEVFFSQTETGMAYKKHEEVFGVAPIFLGARDGRDDPALAKIYLEAIDKGVPLDMSADLDGYLID
tara:strand:+ start:3619 stop:3867 length:249 start_codon:yes stop_codon:yes gene_type:complete